MSWLLVISFSRYSTKISIFHSIKRIVNWHIPRFYKFSPVHLAKVNCYLGENIRNKTTQPNSMFNRYSSIQYQNEKFEKLIIWKVESKLNFISKLFKNGIFGAFALYIIKLCEIPIIASKGIWKLCQILKIW